MKLGIKLTFKFELFLSAWIFIVVVPSTVAEENRVSVNRGEVFLLGDERNVKEGDWKAVFCDWNSYVNCVLSTTTIYEEASRVQLSSGHITPSLSYPSKPNAWNLLFIKGLKIEPGSIRSGERLVSTELEAVSLNWGERRYTITPQWPKLFVVDDSVNSGLAVEIFSSTHEPCINSHYPIWSHLGFSAWILDLDRDKKPDFIINASGGGTACWQYRSKYILILSSLADEKNVIGKAVNVRFDDDVFNIIK
jgi:hypothetical protein